MLSRKPSLFSFCSVCSLYKQCLSLRAIPLVPSKRLFSSRRSPTIRQAESRARRALQPQGQQPKQQGLPSTGLYKPGSNQAVPPLQFLQAARKLGMLHTPPRKTHAFLHAYVAIGPNPAIGRVEKLCVSRICLGCESGSIGTVARLHCRTQTKLSKRCRCSGTTQD